MTPFRRGIVTLTAAIIASSLSACVLWPNVHYYAPKISGTVLRGEILTEGAQVVLSAAFTEETQTSTTDKFGRFALEPLKEFRAIAVLAGDSMFSWSVNVIVDGQELPGYRGGGIGYAGNRVELTCDIDAEIQKGNEIQYCESISGVK